ncbi:MAG: C40 family peptidase [Oscillospiraceae bacterium]|nr:C40 family peptidase [Oscillospiraceae bacterium]
MTKPIRLGLRVICLALCFVCLIGLVRSVSAEAETQPAKTKTTVVRQSAYEDAPVIGQMEDGTEVTVLGKRNGFYKVDCYDMKGYIAKTQIKHTKDGKYIITCQSKSSETKTFTYTDRTEAMTLRHSILALAKKQLGEPYVYGSAGPYGFDCSGLLRYLYSQHDIELQRTASRQLQDGIVVAKEGMQVGDLVFFRVRGETYPASHVGIYVGNNKMIHAGHEGIVYAPLNYGYFYDNFLCARRVIHTGTAQLSEEITDLQQVISRTGISGRQAS